MPASLGGGYIPRMPVPMKNINDGADVSWTMLDGDIGYLRVRRIRGNLNAAFDKAVGELVSAKGLVIDVRGNTGGGFDSATPSGTLTAREHPSPTIRFSAAQSHC